MLTHLLPDSVLQDPKFLAAAKALSIQLDKLINDTKQALHLPRLDELHGIILDLLAEQFHVDFYDAINLSDDEKRTLIRQSIAWHRLKGTPAAVEMVLQDAFRDLRVEEWFDYGGKPYTFRLYTKGYISTPERFDSFMRMLDAAKNVRSHLEQVTFDYSPDNPSRILQGVGYAVGGLKSIRLPRPKNKPLNLKAGAVLVKGGEKFLGLPRPKNKSFNVRAGVAVVKAGTVCFKSRKNPFPPRRLPPLTPAKVHMGIALLRAGVIILKMKEPSSDDEDFVGEGQWLRLYFDYPAGRDHPVLLRNPRPDLIKSDIKAAGKFAAVNHIFLNSRAEGTLGIRKASLIMGIPITNDTTPLPKGGTLRLFFDFPTGNKRKILLHNRREEITVGELKTLGEASKPLLRNCRGESPLGMTHAALIKDFFINKPPADEPIKF